MSDKVMIKPRRARPFWYGNPWVFDGSIDGVRGRPADGDIVEVCDDKGRRIGEGFFNGRSRIRVRLAAWGEEQIDKRWLRARLDQAWELRQSVLGLPERASAYRLVHAEADGLPGLIIDRMGDVVVLQFDCLGLGQACAPAILDWLAERLQPRAVLERVSRLARDQEGSQREESVIAGTLEEGDLVDCEENGIRYRCDPLRGQKTGFYSDQRENRLALAGMAKGRRALDAFCYTGGFAMNLRKRGGAESVVAVDSSQPALDSLAQNLELNGIDGIEPVKANVLRYLDHARKPGGDRFDLVILDPPKLVPKMADLRRGLKLYSEINSKGIAVLEDGGLLATASCSQAVSEEEFRFMLSDVAHHSGVQLQELYRGGQGADHPCSLAHEASRYLKFLVFRVRRQARPDAS